jgi:UDP-N-acetylmuramoyl-tripeptide--D-alanyl-D-alanine ligase
MKLKVQDIINIAKGRLITGDSSAIFTGISTDSRNIKTGDLFIALSGEQYNGHAFAFDAISKGALGVLVMEDLKTSSGITIFVDDTLKALGDIAAYTRRCFDIPVLGITGSSGKTTVKELCASILSQIGPCLKTDKNYNNLIGVPLTLFDLESKHKFAVIEMGTNMPGEIARLAQIAYPNISVITNVIPAHLKGLGSIQGVIEEKQSIFAHTKPGGVAVFGPHLEYMDKVKIPSGLETISFSLSGKADVMLHEIIKQGLDGTEFKVNLRGKIRQVNVKLPGIHNVQNALAACACALALDIPYDAIEQGIRDAQFPHMRLEITVSDSITIIDDSYNANPGSMKAALQILKDATHANKVAVLGDMLELGNDAPYWHEQLGKWVAASNVGKLILTGEFAKTIADAALSQGMDAESVYLVEDIADIKNMIPQILEKDTIVLVKASRALQLDRVVNFLKEAA